MKILLIKHFCCLLLCRCIFTVCDKLISSENIGNTAASKMAEVKGYKKYLQNFLLSLYCLFLGVFSSYITKKWASEPPPLAGAAACQQEIFNNNKLQAFIGQHGFLYLYT